MVGGVHLMMLVVVTVVVVVTVDVARLGDPSTAFLCQVCLHLLPGKTSRIICVKEERSVSLKSTVMVEVQLELLITPATRT